MKRGFEDWREDTNLISSTTYKYHQHRYKQRCCLIEERRRSNNEFILGLAAAILLNPAMET